MTDAGCHFGKMGAPHHRPRRVFAMTVFLLFSFAFFAPQSPGQGKTDRIPIQKPSVQPSTKPQTPPPAPQVPALPGVTIDFELEMKRLESLLALNDKNAEAYYNRGWLNEYKGDKARALQDYTKAIDIDKKLKDAYFNRGLLLARMNRHEEALKDLSEVIRMEPASTDGFCNRGSVHFRMGKVDLALADYEAGLKINSNDADLLYNRALVHLAKGNKAAAAEDLKKSAQMFHDTTRKEFPDLAPKVPPTLKTAALNCRVPDFLNYMSPETKQRAQRFEELRVKVETAFEALHKNLAQGLGDKVQRQKNTLAFSIEGTAPGWVEIFGPKWPDMIRQNPKEPRFFYLSMEFTWKEECRILQLFEACLENPAYCQETALKDSALQMKRVEGVWELADGKRPEEWKQAQAMGEGLLEIQQWIQKFVADNKGKMAYEEMVLSLANTYMEKIAALSNRIKAVK